MENPELRELVDTPRERLDVEYKTWLILENDDTCANLAKHLCALTNNGGGFLVFGINDDMTSAGERPQNAGPFNQDKFSGIIRRYLSPAFQIAVYEVESAVTGVKHPIVWIPPHEAVPVCSKRGGPHKNNKPTGILSGTYYTRAAGPESVPITLPEQWGPIIRRCVLHERQRLLTDIETILHSPKDPAKEPGRLLQIWHTAAHRRFIELADVDPLAEQFKHAHYQFSYQINVIDDQQLDMSELYEQLRRMGHEVLDLVDPGWTMFWVFDEREFAPHTAADIAVADLEFYECNLIRREILEMALPDFWWAAPNGIATLIRPYREDRRDFGDGIKPGTWLWPYIMGREIAEVIRHARAFAERFENVESVSFRTEWNGLKDRILDDPNEPFNDWTNGSAQIDNKVTSRTVPDSHLTSRWTDITADILSTFLRLFNPRFSISPQQIAIWSQQFRK